MAARVPTFKGSVATFRNTGAAGAGLAFLSIYNKTGSGTLVAVRRLSATVMTSASTTAVRTWKTTRITTEPTDGTLLTPVAFDTNNTHNASVEIRSSHSADGVVSALTVTGTLNKAAALFPMRAITSVGQMVPTQDDLLIEYPYPDDPLVLREGEGIVVTQVDSGSTSQDFIIDVAIEEFTYAASGIALVGASAGGATASGVLTTSIALAATSAGVATASANLTTAIRPAGVSAGVATAAGVLTTQIKLVGSSAGVATASGALSSLVGASAGSSTAAGVLTTDIRFAGASAGSATSAGVLTTAIRFAGTSAGVGTTSAALTTEIRFAGTSAGVGAGAGVLTTEIRLAGSSAGVGTGAGALTTEIRLAGTSAGSATAVATFSSVDTALAGSSAGVGSAAGALTTSIRLAGSSAGVSSAVGLMREPTEYERLLLDMAAYWIAYDALAANDDLGRALLQRLFLLTHGGYQVGREVRGGLYPVRVTP